MTRPGPRGQMLPMMGALIAANLILWLWAWRAFQDRPGLLSTALLAWTFGLRHAVDADHIAAIDNVVRKLVQMRRSAWNCGLFFALGHSSVVILMCAAIVLSPSVEGIEWAREAAGDWGTLVSAGFLLLIASANLAALRRLWRARRGGQMDSPPLGGLLSRVLRPVQRLAGRGWHMLAVGFLFGLGFDTATEVALLALTARQAAAGLTPAEIFVLPGLFAAGMMLVDTADSALMTRAYGWASRVPGRDLLYNIAITGLSVFVAFAVGGLELLSLIADRLGAAGQIAPAGWSLAAMPYLGFAIVGVLLSVWAGAVVLGRRATT